MNLAYLNTPDFSFFSDATKQIDCMIEYLKSDHCNDKEHGDIENYIQNEGFEVLRCLFQGYLDLKAANEKLLSDVYTDEGMHLTHIKHGTKRTLTTLFGDVLVKRKSYGQRLQKSIFPLDVQLNLPPDQYSDGIRHRVAIEARKASYDEIVETINQTTGGHIAKRQTLKLAQDIAQDFDGFYLQNRYLNTEQTDNLLVLSFDGKGIVMRPEGLRECTKKAALKSNKLNSRLSAGEKKDRKRMAQVATVYTAMPHIRTPESIMKIEAERSNVQQIKVAERNKRVWASVEKWVEKVALKILHGHGNQVAKGMRISATKQGLTKRENIDKCADYLLKNKLRLQYGEALKKGYPIASGVIEGACRHLINDRLDITGARWSLKGAEAILKLRSLKSSGDFNDYWLFHKKQSSQRIYG